MFLQVFSLSFFIQEGHPDLVPAQQHSAPRGMASQWSREPWRRLLRVTGERTHRTHVPVPPARVLQSHEACQHTEEIHQTRGGYNALWNSSLFIYSFYLLHIISPSFLFVL